MGNRNFAIDHRKMLFDMLMFTFPFKTIKLLFSYTVKTEVHSFFPLLPLPSTASEVSLPAQEHKFPTISTCTDQCMWTHTQMWRVVNSPVCQCCSWQSKQVFVWQWSTVWTGKTVVSATLNASTQPLTEDTAFMLLIAMRMNQNSFYDHSSSMTEKNSHSTIQQGPALPGYRTQVTNLCYLKYS